MLRPAKTLCRVALPSKLSIGRSRSSTRRLASSALAMLARLFRYGKLNHHGAFFNAETGRMSALPIDPQMWTKVRRRNRRLRVAA